jgi:hypothetical protein
VHVGFPVDVNGAGMDDANTYLTCYRLTRPPAARTFPAAERDDSLGNDERTSSCRRRCVSFDEGWRAGGSQPRRFKCYKVRTSAPANRQMTIADAAMTGTAEALRLMSICAPVDTGAGITQPAVPLTRASSSA